MQRPHYAPPAGDSWKSHRTFVNGRPLSWLNIRRLAKRLEGTTEFDDLAIAILPIVEGGEAVTDGLEIDTISMLSLLST